MKIFKKIPLWLLITSIVLLLILLFNHFIYHKIIRPNKEYLPKFVVNLIEERENRQKPSSIVYKEEKTLRIVEGWTLDDIESYLEEFGFAKEDFIKIAGQARTDYREKEKDTWPLDLSAKFDFLSSKPMPYSLEGFLFPDTYRVFHDASAADLIEKMLNNFDKKLTSKLKEEIARQGKDIYDIIIMASLVEKEAAINYNDEENRDARLVAGIFWNRLNSGQLLQSDATLSYWFQDNKPAHSEKELAVDTLYNSYKYPGLPPTPICNPGIKAIEAAIYPIETDYNYFLTSLDGKNIYYATTYAEHLNNKYKYLK